MAMQSYLRLALVFSTIGWLAGLGPALAGPTGILQVVLAAGDDSEPVFDNATREMSSAPDRWRRAAERYPSVERQCR